MAPKNKSCDGSTVTANTVAVWMLREMEKHNGVLYQDDAASQIADRFGEGFVSENDRGNACIDKHVLVAFRELTMDSVVWEHTDRLWRRRESGDLQTRQQR